MDLGETEDLEVLEAVQGIMGSVAMETMAVVGVLRIRRLGEEEQVVTADLMAEEAPERITQNWFMEVLAAKYLECFAIPFLYIQDLCKIV